MQGFEVGLSVASKIAYCCGAYLCVLILSSHFPLKPKWAGRKCYCGFMRAWLSRKHNSIAVMEYVFPVVFVNALFVGHW